MPPGRTCKPCGHYSGASYRALAASAWQAWPKAVAEP